MLQKLSDLSADSAAGKLVRLPLKLIPSGTVLRIRKGLNKGFLWVTGSSIHSSWIGTFEREKQLLAAELVQRGNTVWDVGANAGFYTLGFSRLAGEDGRVYAFEPLAENVNSVLKHRRLNNIENVTIVQSALSDRDRLVGFAVADNNMMGRISTGAQSYLVPTTTVDNFLEAYPEARPDVIKVDVEGAESAVLEGARNLLASHPPKILLALHGPEQERKCTQFLRDFGYDLFRLNGSLLSESETPGSEVLALPSQTE